LGFEEAGSCFSVYEQFQKAQGHGFHSLIMKKIRWGILNTSRIAESSYVPAISASRNALLHAVGSRSREKAEAFAQKHRIQKAYESYDALLADSEIDAVYISLPISLHEEWSIKAALAGKPVLCEKPFSANAAEARRMVETFALRKLLLAEAFMYRLHPLTQKVLSLVREGHLGRLLAVRSSFFVNASPKDIRYQKNLAGGALRDLGSYCINFARLVAGEEPTEVHAVSDFQPGGVDLRTAGVLKFPSGITADFSCGFDLPFSCDYELFGTGGRLRVDHGAFVAWPGEEFSIKLWKKNAFEEIKIPPANHYQLLVEEFSEALLTGSPLSYPPSDAVKNMEVIDRCLAALG
jgi:xylose dehydrogenase (NAD/NADP)